MKSQTLKYFYKISAHKKNPRILKQIIGPCSPCNPQINPNPTN